MLTENPLLRELFTEKYMETLRSDILDVLEARLGDIPQSLSAQIRAIQDEKGLKKLLRFAATCSSLETLQSHVGVQ